MFPKFNRIDTRIPNMFQNNNLLDTSWKTVENQMRDNEDLCKELTKLFRKMSTTECNKAKRPNSNYNCESPPSKKTK